MRRLLLVCVVLTMPWLGLVGGHAADCGPYGSPTNAAGSCESYDNQVQCGDEGTKNGSVTVSATADGAELCNQGDTLPLQGRVGAQHECDCVYIDGDNSNDGSKAPLNGWARVDQDGVTCARRSQPDNESYNSADSGGPLIGACVAAP